MGDSHSATVSVPDWNSAELRSLCNEIPDASAPVPVRGFNGEALETILMILAPTTVPILITWIKSMAESRKAYKVMIDGVSYQGYSPRELAKVVSVLEKHIDHGKNAAKPSSPESSSSTPDNP